MAARRRTTTQTGRSDIVVVNAGPVARRSSGGGGIRRRRSGGSAGAVESAAAAEAAATSRNGCRTWRSAGSGTGLLVKLSAACRACRALVDRAPSRLRCISWQPKSSLIQDIGIAAAAIAGASFGETGTVCGYGRRRDRRRLKRAGLGLVFFPGYRVGPSFSQRRQPLNRRKRRMTRQFEVVATTTTTRPGRRHGRCDGLWWYHGQLRRRRAGRGV